MKQPKTPSWFNCFLPLTSVDLLYNYKERKTPERFSPDASLIAFQLYKPDGDSNPTISIPHDDCEKPEIISGLHFDGCRPGLKYGRTTDIWGLRLTKSAAEFDWNSNNKILEDFAESRPKLSKAIKDCKLAKAPRADEPLSVLRSFFIGPSISHSPPYIVVLSSEESWSKYLVDSIQHELKRPFFDKLRDWGVTRLPKVEIKQYVSGPSSPNTSGRQSPESDEDFPKVDESEAKGQKIMIQLSDGDVVSTIPNPEMLASWLNQQHRCGIRIEVTRDSTTLALGTLGGLVKVGDTFFGLTVAHLLLNPYPARASESDSQLYDNEAREQEPPSMESGSPDTGPDSYCLRRQPADD
ncbi:hypothetical protein FSPOR_11929 [Fusarium sporotrichioides]|uniref:Uncharacterized protein n=1 Tax=Fusarium sporotrichioides TaxID=5514 RepID=A0A395RE51_FUSSP|nr:hypothetical protein FSPOR_11929 [Fusarium sporotrichioides]